MRVGVLTSWRVPCGVYQYSARLVEALARIEDVEPVVLAGRADEHRSVPEEWDGKVYDGAAQIGLWRDDGRYELATAGILGLGLDVVHVQYQSMLFTQPHLAQLCEGFGGVKAVTFHDNCQALDFPYRAFNLHFSHRWNVGPPTVEVIPFGIEDRPPVVRSFGLGRTRSDYIAPICQRHGWIYESAASHEPIQGGGQNWMPHNSLIEWLRGADAIVLWYDDVPQAGESQATRTAIATRRPVFTNATKWFEEMPPRIRADNGDLCYYKARDLEDLEVQLEGLFHRAYLDAHSWDAVAHRLVQRYQKAKTP